MSKIDKAKMWMSNKALIQSRLRYGSIIRIYHKNSEKKKRRTFVDGKLLKKYKHVFVVELENYLEAIQYISNDYIILRY